MNTFIIVFASVIFVGACCLWFLFRQIRQIRKDIKILISYDTYTLVDVLTTVRKIYNNLNETKDTEKIDSIVEQLRDIELLLENVK